MNIFSVYAGIRFRQAFRLVQSVGWLYVFLILPFVVVVFFRVLEMSRDGDWPVTGLFFLASLLGTQLTRKDHDFLSRLGSAPFWFRWVDYLLLFVPIAMALLILGCFKDLILVSLALPLLALIRPPERKINFGSSFSFDFIPLQAFEWRSALRRYGWFLLLLYIIGILASQIMGVGLGVVLLTVLAVAGFYDDLEEKNLLEIYNPWGNFLARKLYWQGLTFHLLMLPHYLLFMIFHSSYWYLLLATILVAQSFLCFYLFFKYAHWQPHQRRAYNQVALSIFTVCMMIPFLALAALFYCWIYYRKARKNLNYYYGQ